MTEQLIRRNTVLEALRANRRHLHKLWVQHNAKNIQPILKEAKRLRLPTEHAKKGRLSQLIRADDHQGVVLEAGPYPYADPHDMLALAEQRGERPFILLLDLIHGTQNIGTLLRTAEICGVHGVILQERRAPDITPLISQYSVGAAEHLLIAKETNLVQTIEFLKSRDVWLAGLDMGADAVTLGQIDLNMPLGLVVGHEGNGLRRLVRDKCDFIVQLPMRGRVESLNASVAGSVMLYAAWQARGFEGL